MKIIFLLLAMTWAISLRSQSIFLSAGSIEFERTINVHKLIDETGENSFYKEIASKLANFNTATFYLDFDSTHALYRPGPDPGDFPEKGWLGPAKDNTVFSDFGRGNRQIAKTIFETKYIVGDSLCGIRWKISGESREIAGFNCRKAVGRICDSVYVTAFYTDEIMVSGGPESFAGLPGMILGLAIPRLHTTWFAKKVTNTPPAAALKMSVKGKNINAPDLNVLLKKATKDWGSYAAKNLWWTTL